MRRIVAKIRTWFYDRYLDLVYHRRGIEGINQVMVRTRRPKHVLAKFGASIGAGTIIYPHIFLHAAHRDYSNLSIGRHCRIMRDCFLDLTDRIEVEDEAIVGLRVSVITHLNVGRSALRQMGFADESAPVRIGRGAVACTNTVILHGVNIGEYALVGAGAVVTRDVAPYTVTAGNPAHVIRRLDESLQTDLIYDTHGLNE